MSKVSARWCSLLLGASVALGIPGSAIAQTLSSATVERLRNRVHLIPSDRNARLARVSDVLSIGDALRTSSSARAQLRFNDGSLARVGEQATFRFTPNTRNFQLSNGTVLLLIPPGRGRTTIQTPNAVTGIQGSALFVRVRCMAELSAEGHCAEPVTFVGALTNNPAGAMLAINSTGSQQQSIYAGEMVVIEGDDITQILEFDLKTFYETSGLADGLELDSASPPENLSDDLQGVWQEIQDALELQGDFDTNGSPEEIVENPEFIVPVATALPDGPRDVSSEALALAAFPEFESSPAEIFHRLGSSVATYPSFESYTVNLFGGVEDNTRLDTNVANSRVEVGIDDRTARPLASAPAPAAAPRAAAALPSRVTTVPSTSNRVVPATSVVPVASSPPTSPTPTNSLSPAAEAPAPTVSPLPTVGVNVNIPNSTEVSAPPVAEPPTTPIPTVAPVVVESPAPVAPPAPVVAEPPAPVAAPVPIVVEAPTPVTVPSEPPVVVETPSPVETPINEPVISEVNQVPTPERSELPPEGFDWSGQRPATNDPEILHSPDSSGGSAITTPDGASGPNIDL